MRLILVRHYKTAFNVSGQIIGWDDSPRATNWAEDLSFVERTLVERKVHPDAIYSSSLGRSRETAKYLAPRLGVNVPLENAKLNEINYGTMTKKSKKWVAAHVPQYKTDADFVFPGGESFRGMQRRSVGFINQLLLSFPADCILCVAHAGVIRGLVSHYLGLELGAQLRRRITHRYIGVLDFVDGACAGYIEWGEPSGFVVDGVLATCGNMDAGEPEAV